MIEIDGSLGEGGGQIVRSSLALSLLTGKRFRIYKLRAGRKKPGLKRQHLTAVKAATTVGNATVSGAELESREITFEPGTVSSGKFEFAISTAGSITLVLQTILPALMMAEGPSTVTLSGGTHNMLAPPFDFLQRSYTPLLARMGPQIDLQLKRYGFYPAGGGEFVANIAPAEQMKGLDVVSRGKLIQRRARGIVSNLPVEIAKRETARVVRKLNWDRAVEEHIEARDPAGPGNILFAELEFENVAASFAGFGRQGISAEKVADGVVREVRRYLKTDAPIGPHLADQIMLPMAIAAAFSNANNRFRTGPLTQHSITQADTIRRFLDVEIKVDSQSDGTSTIAISKAA